MLRGLRQLASNFGTSRPFDNDGSGAFSKHIHRENDAAGGAISPATENLKSSPVQNEAAWKFAGGETKVTLLQALDGTLESQALK